MPRSSSQTHALPPRRPHPGFTTNVFDRLLGSRIRFGRSHELSPRRLHCRRIGEALLRVARETASKPLRELWLEVAEIAMSRQLLRQNRRTGPARKRWMPAQHEHDDRREGEAVGGGSLRLAEQLLGRRERRRARRAAASSPATRFAIPKSAIRQRR